MALVLYEALDKNNNSIQWEIIDVTKRFLIMYKFFLIM